MKKNILIISYILCVLIIACQSDPVPTPDPGEEPTDTIIDTIIEPTPPEEELCEPVCDSCPLYYDNFTGWLKYFEEPILIHGINQHPMFQSMVHAIFMRDDLEADTIGFTNEEFIPECLRKEEGVHVKVCCLSPLGIIYLYNKMEELYCIEKLDD